MSLRVSTITEPTVEPITLAEARSHLRLEATGSPAAHEDDDYVTALIQAAREKVEIDTGRALVQRTMRLRVNTWDYEICLPYAPLLSVTSVEYYDNDGTLQTLSTSIYDVVTDETPGKIRRAYNQSWPLHRSQENAIQITYVAGYADDGASPTDYRANIPAALKQAMYLIIGDLYENREGQIVGVSAMENPAVNALLAPYRVYFQ